MKICVVGAGAIGGLLAYRLAARGHDVSVVARGDHLREIAAHGLTLYDAMRGERLPAIAMPAHEDPAEFGVQEAIIVALKAHAIAPMLPRIAPLLGPQTIVVPAINGLPWWYFHRHPPFEGWALRSLDPQARMFEALDTGRVIGCVVHAAAEVSAPGVVTHTNGWRFVLGEPCGETTPRLRNFAAAMTQAGFDAQLSENIRRDVWWKLLGNLSFNPIAALHGKRMNEICADEALCNMLGAMMTEGMAVCRRLGIEFDATPAQRIDVARQLGAAKISMHQDLEAGRKLELDAIVKSVIELADRLGVDIPTIRAVDRDITRLAVARGLYP